MRKILSITFLLLVFSLAGCGKSSVLPDINQKNCENNPKLLDSLEEQTKVDFQRRCRMFKTWGKHEKPQPVPQPPQ
ncbi:MAG: entry exclusion lipoprotein TrbK [Azoarcus sp.]|nr:entry exclusion lipoprotein TrbK [Azoarcus sp.]